MIERFLRNTETGLAMGETWLSEGTEGDVFTLAPIAVEKRAASGGRGGRESRKPPQAAFLALSEAVILVSQTGAFE